ncbi:MAG: PHP domain-containing protein [Kiritimatiellia bacterium]
MIDLHIHSTFSDGSETPEDIVERGRRLGLSAIALTDHDNMAGVPAFMEACRDKGITGLPGVEVSAALDDRYGDNSTLHILGYGPDCQDVQMRELLSRVLDGRAWRNERIIARLSDLGVELDWDEVEACAGEDVIGRPHIAQAMVDREYVSTVQEAFDRYLAKGAPAYVDRYRLYPEEAARMITDAGGLIFCAHPFTWINDEKELERELRAFKDLGLAGVEVWHSDHTDEQIVALLRIAKKLDLMVSGGSDYHGETKPLISMGTGRGTLAVDDVYAERIIDALGRDNPRIYVKT